jgi:LPPG:FO 2-phospho-L-lactate transferase
LTTITAHLAQSFGIQSRILPMCEAPLRTVVETDQGPLAFQDYFVREQCRPTVRAIRFDGAPAAKLSPQIQAALAHPALAGIFICPSNPWLSIDPILAVPGLREAIRASGAPVIAVSPIIAGKAVKGPTAKIMRELNLDPDAVSIARHYAGLLDGFLIDREDQALADAIATPVRNARTLMRSLEDKVDLARECLGFCAALKAPTGRAAHTTGAAS